MATQEAGVRRHDSAAGRLYELPDGRRLPSVTTVLDVINKPEVLDWAVRVERESLLQAAVDYWDTQKALVLAGASKLIGRYLSQEDVERWHAKTFCGRLAFLSDLKRRVGAMPEHARRKTKAGDLGTDTHKLIEWRLKCQLGRANPADVPKVQPEAFVPFSRWEEWAESVKFEPRLVECPVWSNSFGYAGTLDVAAFLTVDGERRFAIGDWKSGKAIYQQALLQNVAYIQALREMGHLDPADVGPTWGFICRHMPTQADDAPPQLLMISPERQAELLPGWGAALLLYQWQDQEKQRAAAAEAAVRANAGERAEAAA